MTNPDNAIGTNAAYGGRTSVNAFNDMMNIVSRGIISGWDCVPSSGLTVALGGVSGIRDTAAAQDNAGNKTSINNISGMPVEVTLSAAPAANSRIDSIVAYVDNPPQGTSTIADNYEACGIIAVTGTASSSPSAPTDNAIRTAITADGASGVTAYYVVLANITIASGTTDITSGNIAKGPAAQFNSANLDFTTFSNLPVATTSASLFTISSTNAVTNYTRVGNVVFAFANNVFPSIASHAGQTVTSGGVPDGYKPAGETMMYGGAVDGGSGSGNFSVRIKPDNTRTLYNGFTTSSNTRLQLSGTWVTNDAWPTS